MTDAKSAKWILYCDRSDDGLEHDDGDNDTDTLDLYPWDGQGDAFDHEDEATLRAKELAVENPGVTFVVCKVVSRHSLNLKPEMVETVPVN